MSISPLKDYSKATPLLPPRGEAAIKAFTGWDPKYLQIDGRLAPAWERDMIVRVPIPEMRYVLEGVRITRVAVHKKIAQPTRDVFRALSGAGILDILNPYAGGYVARLQRGSAKPSTHLFGLAFDFDPAGNPMGLDPEQSRLYQEPKGREAILILEEYGFLWGGRFESRPDAMHFQFCTGY